MDLLKRIYHKICYRGPCPKRGPSPSLVNFFSQNDVLGKMKIELADLTMMFFKMKIVFTNC